MNGNSIRALCFTDPKDSNVFYMIEDILHDHVALVRRLKNDWSDLGRTFKSPPSWIVKPVSFLVGKQLVDLPTMLEEVTGLTEQQLDVEIKHDTKVVHP